MRRYYCKINQKSISFLTNVFYLRRTMEAHLGVHPKRATNLTCSITCHEIHYDTRGEHDIMLLLQLPNKTAIHPLQLTDCSTSLPVGSELQIAGFGTMTPGPYMIRNGKDEPYELQCEDILIKEPLISRKVKDYFYQYVSCLSLLKDISKGDSGGGWVYDNTLYEVFSFDRYFACRAPAAFLDVCSYKPWIENTFKQQTQSLLDN